MIMLSIRYQNDNLLDSEKIKLGIVSGIQKRSKNMLCLIKKKGILVISIIGDHFLVMIAIRSKHYSCQCTISSTKVVRSRLHAKCRSGLAVFVCKQNKILRLDLGNLRQLLIVIK